LDSLSDHTWLSNVVDDELNSFVFKGLLDIENSDLKGREENEAGGSAQDEGKKDCLVSTFHQVVDNVTAEKPTSACN
jgi:hypothetical protein